MRLSGGHCLARTDSRHGLAPRTRAEGVGADAGAHGLARRTRGGLAAAAEGGAAAAECAAEARRAAQAAAGRAARRRGRAQGARPRCVLSGVWGDTAAVRPSTPRHTSRTARRRRDAAPAAPRTTQTNLSSPTALRHYIYIFYSLLVFFYSSTCRPAEGRYLHTATKHDRRRADFTTLRERGVWLLFRHVAEKTPVILYGSILVHTQQNPVFQSYLI